jgi:ATP-dependent Lon protease
MESKDKRVLIVRDSDSEDGSNLDSDDLPIIKTPKKKTKNENTVRRSKRIVPLCRTAQSDSSDGDEDETLGTEDTNKSGDSWLSDDIGNEEDDYWEKDLISLKKVIETELKKELSRDQIEKVVDVVNSALQLVAGTWKDYASGRPKDTMWKINLDENTIRVLEPHLKTIREKMAEEEPTMLKILQASIPISSKIRAVRYYDLMMNEEPYTLRRLELQDKIQDILSTAMTNDQMYEIEKIDGEEARLRSGMPPSGLQGIKKKIIELETTDKIKQICLQTLDRYESLPPASQEKGSIGNKLITLTSLPFDKRQYDPLEKVMDTDTISAHLDRAMEIMNAKLYGLEHVKSRFLMLYNNFLCNPKTKKSFALQGPAGVGKTTIASVFAEILNLPIRRIPLGGMTDPSIFKGTGEAWVGAGPSIILQIMAQMKINNGVILFDELDKLSSCPKGEAVQFALIHITDPSQNKEFEDEFINETNHDISNIWYFYSLNNEDKINAVLFDRLKVIKIKPYTRQELKIIVRDYVLPKTLENVGMKRNDCTITDEACGLLISMNSEELEKTGVRVLERAIDDFSSKINMLRRTNEAYRKKLSYNIPNFSLPLTITTDIVRLLNEDKNAGIPENVMRMFS